MKSILIFVIAIISIVICGCDNGKPYGVPADARFKIKIDRNIQGWQDDSYQMLVQGVRGISNASEVEMVIQDDSYQMFVKGVKGIPYESEVNMVIDSSMIITVECPCYIGDDDISNSYAPVTQVIGADSMNLKLLPGSTYDVIVKNLNK